MRIGTDADFHRNEIVQEIVDAQSQAASTHVHSQVPDMLTSRRLEESQRARALSIEEVLPPRKIWCLPRLPEIQSATLWSRGFHPGAYDAADGRQDRSEERSVGKE